MTGSSYSAKWKKAIKKLPVSWNIKAEEEILDQLVTVLGKENVKVRKLS